MDVCNRSLETVRHSRNLGMEVLSAEEDGVRVRLPWREDLVGNPDTGVLHGGAIFAMMDQAGKADPADIAAQVGRRLGAGTDVPHPGR